MIPERHQNKKQALQSNLAKGRIANLSPLAAANRFVRSWPHLIPGSMDPPARVSPLPKRHLDWFSHFCTAHPCDQHTNRHTDHATCDICSNRPHLCTAAWKQNWTQSCQGDFNWNRVYRAPHETTRNVCQITDSVCDLFVSVYCGAYVSLPNVWNCSQ